MDKYLEKMEKYSPAVKETDKDMGEIKIVKIDELPKTTMVNEKTDEDIRETKIVKIGEVPQTTTVDAEEKKDTDNMTIKYMAPKIIQVRRYTLKK
ncbi:hypothetical protein IKO70_02220 [bacterium]|nr:hypothetical protein [bacterium]